MSFTEQIIDIIQKSITSVTSEDWDDVCEEIISNLFETQSERYFNSIGIKTLSSKSDKDPDLFFIDYQKPCEIKVTGVEYSKIDKCK
jgi:hypothetical protein